MRKAYKRIYFHSVYLDIGLLFEYAGCAVTHLVETLRCKPDGRGFGSRLGYLILPTALCP